MSKAANPPAPAGAPERGVHCGCGYLNPSTANFCGGCGAPSGRLTTPRPDHAPNPRGRTQRPGPTRRTPPAHRQWSLPFLRDWAIRNRPELLTLLLLTTVAAFLRVYRLEDIPAGFHGDEAWSGLDGLRILEEGWIGPYTTSAVGQMAGPFYLTAQVIRIFGASVFAVRLSMALFGIATVPAAYLLLRVGFGRWVALAGAASLTVSYWHLHFSRLGFNVIPLAFATTTAAAALLWAMAADDGAAPETRRRTLLKWLLAGALLGLVPYTYLAFFTFLAAAAVVLTVYFLLQKERFSRKLISLSFLALGALITAAPALQSVLGSPNIYLARMSGKSLAHDHRFVEAEGFADRAAYFTELAWDAATLLVRNPRFDAVDGIGQIGVVDYGIAALAYFGLLVSIRKWRSPPHLFAVLVVVAAFAGLVITDPSAGSMRRTIAAVPWVFGLAAVGAATIVGLARRRLGKPGQFASAAALALVFVAGGLWNLQYYFVGLPQTPTFRWSFTTGYFEALDAAHAFDEPGTIYYYSAGRRFGFETIRFLYPHSRGIDRSHEFGEFGLERLDEGPVTYLLEGPYMEEIDRIREIYPDGELVVDDEPQPRFIIYHLPR